jgi:hypothetical protein
MNMPAKVTAFVFAIIMNVSCSGMIIKHQLLPNDCLGGICRQITDRPTKLSARATSRCMRNATIIEELENYYMALKGERKFYIEARSLVYDKYLNNDFTKERATELGWQHGSSAFSSDGALVRTGCGVDDVLFLAAYNHVCKSEGELFDEEYQTLKKIFRLANKLENYKGQRDIILHHVPNNVYGINYVFGTGIVRKAILKKDWDFARDLIITNPHDCAVGHDSQLSRYIQSSYSIELGISSKDKNLEALIELAQVQPSSVGSNAKKIDYSDSDNESFGFLLDCLKCLR